MDQNVKLHEKTQNGITTIHYIGKKDKRKPPDTVVYCSPENLNCIISLIQMLFS